MNYSDTRFTLDVQLHQAQVSVSATLNDTARRLCVGFTDGRKPYIIADGCTASFAAKKPDGLALFNACTIENNTIIYEFTPQTTNVIGTYECEIRLYNEDGLQLTSPRFLLVVDEQAVNDDDVIDSFTEVTMLNQIIANETERIVKEDERIAKESERIANEETRQNNEAVREEQELSRLNSEASRSNFEVERRTNEETRQNNEAVREEQELSRLNSEASRSNFEVERRTNENERITNEETRKGNENTRIANENKRIANETARDTAEQGRASAEEERKAVMGDLGTALDGIIDLQERQKGDDYILATAYPVGSIYMSVNATDPASLFGGSWVRLKDRFLLGAGDTYGAGTEGGSADAVVVKHTHKITKLMAAADTIASGGSTLQKGYGDKAMSDTIPDAVKNYALSEEGVVGKGKNMPPYLAVYMWKRTA